jgi:2-polyprenyl-3-methyl-5-hydroxy-6-metoxy-1,4-benzoquinol methylase
MGKDRGSWLWNLMAFFYDQFYTRFPPYQSLIRDIIKNLPKPNSAPVWILDAGCGTGLISLSLARHHFQVIGFDRSAEMLRQALRKTKKFRLPNLRFEERDLNRAVDPPRQLFHAILFIHSLYLLDNPKETLRQISTWILPEGDLILCNPVRSITKKELLRGGVFCLNEIMNKKDSLSILYLLPIIASMGLLNLIIQRKKERKAFHCWTPKEMESMLEECGFKVKWAGSSCLGRSHLLVRASRTSK